MRNWKKILTGVEIAVSLFEQQLIGVCRLSPASSLCHLNRSTFSSSPCVMIHHRSRVTAMTTTTTTTTNQTFAAHDFRTWVFGRLGHGTEPPSLGGKTPKASGSRTCARHSLNVDRWINVVRRRLWNSENWCFHSLTKLIKLIRQTQFCLD